MTREAISTIKGYFYQFDRSISELLMLKSMSDTITVEGIEDIDIDTVDGIEAVQCKYYESTEFYPSKIAKPIRLMLIDFAERAKSDTSLIRYKIYGYFKSGQDRLIEPISIEFLKTKLLTHKAGGKQIKHYEVLGLSDEQLKKFLRNLSVDIHADEFDQQQKNIINELSRIKGCSDFESESFYYGNALVKIKNLSIQKVKSNRKISKKDFLEFLSKKEILFTRWLLQLTSEDKHWKKIKSEFFTGLNVSPFERFFLIEFKAGDSLASLIDIVQTICRKYSKLSQREKSPFCPYFYIHGIASGDFIRIKKKLIDTGHLLIDGYQYKGAEFNPEQLLTVPTSSNGIKSKFINSLEEFDQLRGIIAKTTEIYQFYFDRPFYNESDSTIKCISIQIEKLATIKKIL